MSMLDQLIDMGFSKEKAESALKATNEQGLEQAMDWLINQQEQDTGAGNSAAAANPTAANTAAVNTSENTKMEEDTEERSTVELIEDEEPAKPAATDMEVRSLKCEDCGKLLADQDAALLHAERTKHVNFGESADAIRPLSEEEKQQRKEQLRSRIAERRTVKDEEERRQAIELEKKRRLEGQEVLAAKERMKETEMKKLADEKKREKQAEKMAKERVLEQIKRDREARKLEAAALATGQPIQQPAPSDVAPPPERNYDECKLQIRLTDGKALVQSFGSKEQLAAVRLWIQLHRTDGDVPFNLMTPFPRHVFSEEDFEKPLTELGLVPTAVVVLTRAQ
uniref:UBX domain-containing protein 1 n=1 Tax=Plectus sambesii TaxID=2011161 RepID=A0A914VTY3_9BILA